MARPRAPPDGLRAAGAASLVGASAFSILPLAGPAAAALVCAVFGLAFIVAASLARKETPA